MTDRPLDPRHDRLVAALLGELDPEERSALERDLTADADLRRQWEELQQARALLHGATAGSAEDADFTFTWPTSAAPRRPAARAWLAAAAGFVLAATLFAALLLLGLRADRHDGTLVIAFGPTPAPSGPRPVTAAELAAAVAERGPTPAATVSRSELAAGLQTVLDVTEARFNALERRQTETQAMLSRSLYEALTTSQQRQIEALATQIRLASLDGGAGSRLHRAQPSLPPFNDVDHQGEIQ